MEARNEGTRPAHSGQPEPCRGFAKVPNVLLRTAPLLALGIYGRIAATPRIWMRRGPCGPNEVRVSLRTMAADLGATVKEVRGAVAWLIDGGWLSRVETGNGKAGILRIEDDGARSGTGLKLVTATTSEGADKPQGHGSSKRGTVRGTVRPHTNGKPDNGLRRSPQPARARLGAKVLKDSQDNSSTPPDPPARRTAPAPSAQGGGDASHGGFALNASWRAAFEAQGLTVPDEPSAQHPDRWRGAALDKWWRERRAERPDREAAEEHAICERLMGIYGPRSAGLNVFLETVRSLF